MKPRSGKSRGAHETSLRDEDAEGPLARWSRRKAMARAAAATAAEEPDAEPLASPAPLSPAILTDADMPALEGLDAHSDYSGFLSPGVSERLRRRALRKLFHLAQFNVHDGLDDYAEDYTNFAPLGDVLTADLRLQKERLENALRKEVAAKEGKEADGETSVEKSRDGAPPGREPDGAAPASPNEEAES